ncbi:MAG: S9 family peptidase [Myxococcales bacterium]|nr:S9 family peptidase [Myxococcales bacterium]
MMLRIGLSSAIACFLTVASATAEPPAIVAEPPATIAVDVFFRNPTMSQPTLSPDGKHIAFVFSNDDIQRVFVRKVVGSDPEGLAVFPMQEVRLDSIEWANSRRLLLSTSVSDPDAREVNPSKTRLYGVNRDRPNLKWLGEKWRKGESARQDHFEDKVISLLPSERDYVLVSHLERGEEIPSVSRLNIVSGRLRLQHAASQGIGEWYVDQKGNVRAAEASDQAADGKSYTLLARSQVSQELEPVFEAEDHRNNRFRFAGFHEDSNLLYVIADHEGRDALFEFNIASRSLGDLVFAHPEFDVTGAQYSEARQKIVGANFTADGPEIAFFDADEEREQGAVDKSLLTVQGHRTSNRIVSATADGNLAIIEVGNHVQPPVYYAYDRSKKEINFIFEQHPDIPVDQLAEVKRINFAARDGSNIPGYLTLPTDPGSDKLPMIVLPHDGPSARDALVYNPVVQFFANRGFAVLQVNYRGSSGFGREFRLAGNEDWGRVIQEDIADGVKWAIREGIADPDRVGIFGTGFGGYSALMGLVTTPKLYRAGASFAGITGLDTSGDDGGGVRMNSPLRNIDEIQVPVLLGHGARDSRVAVDHARKLKQALEAAGKNVKYLEYADDAEGLVLESSRIDFYSQLLSFFETNLAASTPPPAPAKISETAQPMDAPAEATDDLAEPIAEPAD